TGVQTCALPISEDLQNNEWLTKDVGAGGAGFGVQWDANFVHPIRQAVITPEDAHRSLPPIRDALCYRYNDDAFARVIYSESHDEVANGKARVPQEVNPQDPKGWYARKRSTLAAAMVFTAPSPPMRVRGRNSLKVHGSATQSPSIGTSATSSTASCGCTAISCGCGSTATATRAASVGRLPSASTCT